MMRGICLFILCIGMTLSVSKSMAQTDINDFTYQLIYEFVSDQLVPPSDLDNVGQLSGDDQTNNSVTTPFTSYIKTCKVQIPDTISIAKINVMIGTKRDTSDIFYYSFNFDETVSLPEQISWKRVGNEVFLGLYKTLISDMHYYKVWLEGVNGEISEPKFFY